LERLERELREKHKEVEDNDRKKDINLMIRNTRDLREFVMTNLEERREDEREEERENGSEYRARGGIRKSKKRQIYI